MGKIEISSKDTSLDIYAKMLRHLSIEFNWELSHKESLILAFMYNKLIELLMKKSSYEEANIILFSQSFKESLLEGFNSKKAVLANMFTKFRKCGIFEGTSLSKRYIFGLKNDIKFIVNYEIQKEK